MFQELEMCQIKENRRAGRTEIIMTGLTVNNRGEWNKRGMTWLENYVNDNIESAKTIPFVVSFIDNEKSIPSGHGTLSYDEDGNCQFLDSEVVGSVEDAFIESVEVDGEIKKRLVLKGVLYKQRYPNFVKYLKKQIKEGINIKGSIEANGKGDSKKILYETGDGKNPDGTWQIGRVPTIFDFSGCAILLPDVVEPADDGSEIIELNTTTDTSTQINHVDDIYINEDKEDFSVMEDEIKQLQEEVNSLKTKLEEKDVEVNSLKEEIAACKQTEEINSLKTKLDENQASMSTLTEELNTLKAKEEELNSAIVTATKQVETKDAIIAELNSELEPLRVMKAEIEKNQLKSEVDTYFKQIKEENGFDESELNELQPFADGLDLTGLKAKETELCVKKFKELKKTQLATSETNSLTEVQSDLFFSTKPEQVVETNSKERTEDGSCYFYA